MPERGGVVELPEIRLKKGGIIKGKVYRADGKTVFRDVQRICAKGFDTANREVPDRCTGGREGERVKEDGSYIITQVPPSRNITLEIVPYGYMMQKVEGVKVEPGKITYADFVIPTDDPTGIRGIITDAETGKPIEGATVGLKNSEIDKLGNDVGIAMTGKDGYFAIKGLIPGIYDISVFGGSKYMYLRKKDKKVSEGKELFMEIKLKLEDLNNKNLQVIIEDPTAINVNCDKTLFDDLIEPAFKKAQAKLQTGNCALSAVWSNLSKFNSVNIYCTPSPRYGDFCASVPSLGKNVIRVHVKPDGSFYCPMGESLMYHELIHVAGFDENDAYTCGYKCYGISGGCITCEEATVQECRGLYIEKDFCTVLPNPSFPGSACLKCDKFARKVIDPCDDNDPCTLDICDATTQTCAHQTGCDDKNVCTEDKCRRIDTKMECIYEPIDCDDNNLCTDDSCDSVAGCINEPKECPDQTCKITKGCNPSTGECESKFLGLRIFTSQFSLSYNIKNGGVR